MPGLGGSNQDPSVKASAAQAPQEVPPRSSTPTDSLSSVTSSTDNERTEYDPENNCFYIKHLESRHLRTDRMRDFFLLEHLTSGHLTGCSHLSGSNADGFALAAHIREEAPFDLVQSHHLQLVNLRDELLSPRHIRLLKLYSPTPLDLPGDTHDVRECSLLRCEAYQACLDDLTTNGQPLFAAASYVCGDQTPTQRILCGQRSISIAQNAYDVLFHLRFDDRPRLVWIDCLCIKQNDAREKSHQVSMLHTIYAQAHVVSWLGMDLDIGLPGLSFHLSLLARCWIEEVRRKEPSSPWESWMHNMAKVSLERYLESQVNALPHRDSLRAIA